MDKRTGELEDRWTGGWVGRTTGGRGMDGQECGWAGGQEADRRVGGQEDQWTGGQAGRGAGGRRWKDKGRADKRTGG